MSSEPSPRGINNWQDAETNAAMWMRRLGFTDARLTGGSSDKGIDVRSFPALAQVKWQGKAVGSPALQMLVGAREGDHQKDLLFFSNAGYTAPAVQYADRNSVALFTYEVATGFITAANGHARQLAARAPESADASVRIQDVLPKPASGDKASGCGCLAFAILFTLSAVAAIIDAAQARPEGTHDQLVGAIVLSVASWLLYILIRVSRRW